jgi:opacity protein-like surface antigen
MKKCSFTKNMLKLLVVLLVILSSSSAYSENNNNFFVGLEMPVINMAIDSEIKKYNSFNGNVRHDYTYSDTDTMRGYGAVLGYEIFVKKKLFIAPQIFYQGLGAKIHHKNTTNGIWYFDEHITEIKCRYGFKTNIGYDFEPYSIFAILGYGAVDIDTHVNIHHDAGMNGGQEGPGPYFRYNDDEWSMIFGLGTEWNFSDNMGVYFTYMWQPDLEIKKDISYVDGFGDTRTVNSTYDLELNTYTFGIAYHF